MIVDLARNDLSRVCDARDRARAALCAVESHPTVHQLVSTVTGQLAPARRARPGGGGVRAGLDDGAPKVRAMQLIEQLEPVRRGPYAGAFGWLSPDGACDLAVVIRTAVVTPRPRLSPRGRSDRGRLGPRRGVRGVAREGRTVAGALGATINP